MGTSIKSNLVVASGLIVNELVVMGFSVAISCLRIHKEEKTFNGFKNFHFLAIFRVTKKKLNIAHINIHDNRIVV